MKIIERSFTKEKLEERDYSDFYSLTVNDKETIFARDYGEPEDNSLKRDLNFVYRIVGLMRMAYEAGKSGEEFEVTKELVDEM